MVGDQPQGEAQRDPTQEAAADWLRANDPVRHCLALT